MEDEYEKQYENDVLNDDSFADFQLRVDVESVDERILSASVVKRISDRILNKGFNKSNLEQEIKDRVLEEVDRRIDEIVAEKLDNLMQLKLRRTDAFGSPLGEPKAVSTIISEGVEPYLNQIVDNNDRPVKGDPFYANKESTRLERAVSAALGRHMGISVKNAAKEAGEAVQQRIKEKAAAIMAEALSRV